VLRLSNKHQSRPLMEAIRARHPRFRDAVLADTRMALLFRGEPGGSRLVLLLQVLRLSLVSDAFLGQVLYRAKARLQARGIPILPALAHRGAVSFGQVIVGDPVIVHAGVYLPHGQVVIDGLVEIQSGTHIRPWVTIGLREGDPRGPTIGRNVKIGTGAKIIGPVHIGDGATIGANAVVVDDVPVRATVAGIPARDLHAPR
jgi:serine O-acetyltransferase